MWIALLLITHVCCEWVEISQQHYRKPVRITHKTENPQVYANTTISPAIWAERKPSTGIKRLVSSNNRYTEPENVNNRLIHEAVTEKFEENKDLAGTVERVTNVGKIKRVQLSNSPVKSPSVANVSSSVRNVFTNHDYIVTFNNNREQYISTTEASPFRSEITRIPFKNHSVKNEPSYFSEEVKNIYEDNSNTYHATSADVTKVKIDKITHIETVTKPNTKKLDTSSTDEKSMQNFNSKIPELFTSENTFKVNDNLKANEKKNIQYRKENPKRFQNDDDGQEKATFTTNTPTEETPTPKTKANTMEALFKIMKAVADTISKNSHRSLNSKMKYLHQLKNTLLDNIENRIDSIWPDDTNLQDSKQGGRYARETSRGHVEFPSSESALMTISFLTFAVFLIKLVLQVIQTYKTKTMMVAPLVVASAGRAALKRLRAKEKHDNL